MCQEWPKEKYEKWEGEFGGNMEGELGREEKWREKLERIAWCLEQGVKS